MEDNWSQETNSTLPEGKEFISAIQLEILHNIDNDSSVNLEDII